MVSLYSQNTYELKERDKNNSGLNCDVMQLNKYSFKARNSSL